MVLETLAISRQWLSSNRVGTPTDTKATVTLQQRNSIFHVARAEML
jgi:hypothetical protein